MIAHESHEWGPALDGTRRSQCGVCTCFRHEPEAVVLCDPSCRVMAAARAWRGRIMGRLLAMLARAEAGGPAMVRVDACKRMSWPRFRPVPGTAGYGYGLWQVTPGIARERL